MTMVVIFFYSVMTTVTILLLRLFRRQEMSVRPLPRRRRHHAGVDFVDDEFFGDYLDYDIL